MHNLGKVLAFLVVVAAIIAALFTAKLIQIRNSYTLKANTAKNKFLDLQPKIEALQAKIDSVRAEIFRSQELWGTAIPNVQSNIANKAEGTVHIGIGTDGGIRPNMLLHGFQMVPEAGVIYRGSFLVADAQKNESLLKPNFRVTPDDVKTWDSGVWRWRNALPSGYQETFDRQMLAILKDEETLRARAMTLEGQKELLKKSMASLKQRETELIGGEGMAKSESVGSEFREGLVAAIEKIEEDRNEILLKVDELRRAVRNVNADIERLHSENTDLVDKLPRATPRDAVTQKK